ncbi:thiol-disulfide oxidoreductase DCC family protein [Woodsholea maritima]|uniref:thiol-disulfide oxidoreductase DCC family protein n=1 Tax=Woodsholea maritima TaxID=240237 RepID=UPI00035C1C8D|nr:DUF393 domain-containing protein [Woodsholea maritima]
MTEPTSNTTALTVCYDGACPVCRTEIDGYRAQGVAADFVDISQDLTSLEHASGAPDQAQLMARFHVRDENGAWISGFAAFCAVWQRSPKMKTLGKICAQPPIVWIGEGLYRCYLIFRPLLKR